MDGWMDGVTQARSCCWKFDSSLKMKANVVLSELDCCLLCFFMVPAPDQGAWFVYMLHSLFFLLFLCCLLQPVIIAIKWFWTTKSPTFLYRINILLLNKITTTSIRTQKIAQRVLLHLYKDLCSQNIIGKCMLRIHICVMSIRGQFQALLILWAFSRD